MTSWQLISEVQEEFQSIVLDYDQIFLHIATG